MSDEEEEDESATAKGYCHYNENNECNTFSIDVFGVDLVLAQNPGSRNLGHGAVVWDAAVIFAKYAEYNPKEYCVKNFQDAKVLELGSGCGLAGLALLMKGARVTFSDLPNVANELTEPNANKLYRYLRSQTSTALGRLNIPNIVAIDWTTFTLDVFKDMPDSAPFDYILLTDCVFSVLLIPHLISTIRQCCGPATEVICCFEHRDEDASAAFLAELKNFFNVRRIPFSKMHPDYRNDLVQLLVAKPFRGSKKSATAAT